MWPVDWVNYTNQSTSLESIPLDLPISGNMHIQKKAPAGRRTKNSRGSRQRRVSLLATPYIIPTLFGYGKFFLWRDLLHNKNKAANFRAGAQKLRLDALRHRPKELTATAGWDRIYGRFALGFLCSPLEFTTIVVLVHYRQMLHPPCAPRLTHLGSSWWITTAVALVKKSATLTVFIRFTHIPPHSLAHIIMSQVTY